EHAERVFARVFLHFDCGDAERHPSFVQFGQMAGDMIEAAINVQHGQQTEHDDDRYPEKYFCLDHAAIPTVVACLDVVLRRLRALRIQARLRCEVARPYALIFWYSVLRGTSRRTAASATLPPVSCNTRSMCWRSICCSVRLVLSPRMVCAAAVSKRRSLRVMMQSSHNSAARSRTLRSSRILPGHL